MPIGMTAPESAEANATTRGNVRGQFRLFVCSSALCARGISAQLERTRNQVPTPRSPLVPSTKLVLLIFASNTDMSSWMLQMLKNSA